MVAKMTELRRRRTAEGLCWACGMLVPAEGKKICLACHSDRQELDRKRRARYKVEGKCPKCLQPSPTDKLMCQSCMDAQVQASRERRKENKEFLYNHFGSKCNRCTETDIVVMSLDHVNNDGAEDKHQGTISWYAKLVKRLKAGLVLEKELQMLCFNCHAKKDLIPWWMKDET